MWLPPASNWRCMCSPRRTCGGSIGRSNLRQHIQRRPRLKAFESACLFCPAPGPPVVDKISSPQSFSLNLNLDHFSEESGLAHRALREFAQFLNLREVSIPGGRPLETGVDRFHSAASVDE